MTRLYGDSVTSIHPFAASSLKVGCISPDARVRVVLIQSERHLSRLEVHAGWWLYPPSFSALQSTLLHPRLRGRGGEAATVGTARFLVHALA